MKNRKLALFSLWGAVCLASLGCVMVPLKRQGSQGFRDFIRRDGAVLREGGREFKFISFNIPNLHYVEDDMRLDEGMPFRLPNDFEINDALGTIEQLGGQVVRIYALSVRRADDPSTMPRHILGPGKFNEEAFVALDHVLAAANRHRVRLIIPFVDNWIWWGGIRELAGFRGKSQREFWTDPQVFDDYRQIVSFLVNRVNTVTGTRYRDDKAILAWETGNELGATEDWTRRAAAAIKSLDPNHLVLDGATRGTVPAASLNDPNIDLVTTHHYEKDPRQMIGNIVRNAGVTRGKKPYFVGEFGFLGTEAMCAVLDTVRQEKLTGALVWSLRCRSRDGGFYWHAEPSGGDLFKAYHWPGFESGESYDERRFMQFMRERAYEIQGLAPPPIPAPAPPRLLLAGAGGMLNWQGAVGAASYDIERAESPAGPWAVAGLGVSEAEVQYLPPFVDESAQPGKNYYYRVVARNHAGPSRPSNVLGPVRLTHRTLVDELANDSRIFLKQGTLAFRENEARTFKEHAHRISGAAGSAIVYRVPEGIRDVRAYAFSRTETPGIRISFSKDCQRFEPAQTRTARTITFGESDYNFWKSFLCTAVCGEQPGCTYMKIEFLAEAQVARVEIDYGNIE